MQGNDVLRSVAKDGRQPIELLPQVQVVTLIENQLLTYRQVQQYFGISRTELKEAKAAGLLAYYPAGSRGVRFRVSEINRYILDRETRLQRGMRRTS